jgi:uncharacterized protein (TIGR02466 family)|tara:strand:+ start:89 stop:694 length:606 start_codon:yes stop_codon:yes gene_type:complete
MINYTIHYWGPLLFKTKISEGELQEIKKLCKKDPEKSYNKSLAGDIKHEYLIDEKKVNDVLQPYLYAFRKAYTDWYAKSIDEVKASEAWVNYMQQGDFNPLHMHNGCDFSSVLYLSVPKELQEEIKRYRGTSKGPGCITFIYGEESPYCGTWHIIQPEERDIFIFPYNLRHAVNPYKSKCERVSVAINFIVKGGHYDKKNI